MLTTRCPREEKEALAKSLLWPLNMFYSRDDRELPEMTPLMGHHLPQPQKQLLVHTNNMTPTLETHHGDTIHIEQRNVMPGPMETSREVILHMDGDDKAVEYGASLMFLERLPDEACTLIGEGRMPLGTILQRCGCTHSCEVRGFFKIRPMPFFADVFGVPCKTPLYGRRNSLVAPDGQAIAEVCEILPPVNGAQQEGGIEWTI